VIALQEANTSERLPGGRTQYADLVLALNRWATGSNHYRAVRPSLDSNATRIAYDTRTVRLLRAGAYRWHAQEMRVDGARMMAWATFRQRATGRRFFFASVHLETASTDVRWRQWRELVRVVPRLAHGLPVVLGGDFNATRNTPHEPARRMLPRMRKAGFGDTLGQYGEGYLTYRQARPRRVVWAQFNSVNRFQRRLGHFPHHSWVGLDVDYVFASNRLAVPRWELVADVAPGSDRLRGTIPSDHNLIRVSVALRR
jgi:endonuclease/exonuclease/phosphatase family metal-dependent hydrolase